MQSLPVFQAPGQKMIINCCTGFYMALLINISIYGNIKEKGKYLPEARKFIAQRAQKTVYPCAFLTFYRKNVNNL